MKLRPFEAPLSVVLDDAGDLPNGNYAAQNASGQASCTAHISEGTSYEATCELVRAKMEEIANQQTDPDVTVAFQVISCDFKGGPVSMSAQAVAGDHSLKIAKTQKVSCCTIL